MRVHRNCCGLAAHKQTIAACLISESEDGSSRQQKRIFGNITQPARAGAVAGRGHGHGGGHGSDRNFRMCQGAKDLASLELIYNGLAGTQALSTRRCLIDDEASRRQRQGNRENTTPVFDCQFIGRGCCGSRSMPEH
jgi:hypothetical protein